MQVRFYGQRDVWAARREEVSDAVHRALVNVWQIPAEKRFHRFLLSESSDIFVSARGAEYLVVEVLCFSGRSIAAKRALVRSVFDDVAPALHLGPDDLELVVLESPPRNWGIRGHSGDDLDLAYRVDV